MPNLKSNFFHVTVSTSPSITEEHSLLVIDSIKSLGGILDAHCVLEKPTVRPHLHAAFNFAEPIYKNKISDSIKKILKDHYPLTRNSIRISTPPDRYLIYSGYHTKEDHKVLYEYGLDPEIMSAKKIEYQKQIDIKNKKAEKKSDREICAANFVDWFEKKFKDEEIFDYESLFGYYVEYTRDTDDFSATSTIAKLKTVLFISSIKLNLKKKISHVILSKELFYGL